MIKILQALRYLLVWKRLVQTKLKTLGMKESTVKIVNDRTEFTVAKIMIEDLFLKKTF